MAKLRIPCNGIPESMGYLGAPRDYTREDIEAEARVIRAKLEKHFENAILMGFAVTSPYGWPITIPKEITDKAMQGINEYVDYVLSTYTDGVLVKGENNG